MNQLINYSLIDKLSTILEFAYLDRKYPGVDRKFSGLQGKMALFPVYLKSLIYIRKTGFQYISGLLGLFPVHLKSLIYITFYLISYIIGLFQVNSFKYRYLEEGWLRIICWKSYIVLQRTKKDRFCMRNPINRYVSMT